MQHFVTLYLIGAFCGCTPFILMGLRGRSRPRSRSTFPVLGPEAQSLAEEIRTTDIQSAAAVAFARVMPCLAAAELSLDVAIPSGLLVLQPPDRMAALLEALIYEMLRGAQERLFLSVAEQDDLILVKVMNDARWAIPAAFAASLETLPDKARRCGATLSFEVVSEGCRLVMGLERYIPASNELTCQGLESTPVAEAALVPVCRVPQPAGWSVDPVIAPHAVRHAPGA